MHNGFAPGKEVREGLKKGEVRDFGQGHRGMRHMTREKMTEASDADRHIFPRYENGNAEMGILLYRKEFRLYIAK